MRPTDDVQRGDWIAPRLTGWGPASGVVPTGFAAYARVLHPVTASRVVSEFPLAVEERRMRWAEVAAAVGATAHPAMQWLAVVGDADQPIDVGDGWGVDAPSVGRVDRDTLAALASVLAVVTDPGHATAAVWVGFGDLRPADIGVFAVLADGGSVADEADAVDRARAELAATVSPEVTRALGGPLLELPDRSYLLLDCDVRELADPTWTDRAGIGWHWGGGPTPNLLWPTDRSWCLATEIDYDSTLVGGSADLVAAVLAHPALEAQQIDPTTDLSAFGDRING